MENRYGEERFVFAEHSYYELLGEEAAAKEIMVSETISDYMGMVFEQICQQYMVRQAKADLQTG